MNVPLSVGPQYLESDHAGIECIVFDIIVNIKVIEDCIEDETGQYRDFLCHLCIQSVEQKYPALGTLDRQYKLPKLLRGHVSTVLKKIDTLVFYLFIHFMQALRVS